MKYFDIDAYLDGALTGEALAAFETELRGNPDFAQEVAAFKQLTADIEMQTLREHVTTVLKETNPLGKKPNLWCHIVMVGGVIAGILITYLVYIHARSAVVPPMPPTDNRPLDTLSYITPQITDNQSYTITEKQTNPSLKVTPVIKNAPVQIDPKPAKLPTPVYSSPNITGKKLNLNKNLQMLLDKIWHAQFPPYCVMLDSSRFALVAHQLINRDFTVALESLEMEARNTPQNDTLHFLKGYCLLEMGEGTGALHFFEHLEDRQPNWEMQLEWYRALSVLIEGDAEKTVPKFKKIAFANGHRYQKPSLEILKLLK